ncbi:Protease 2 [Hordeum vulgare]|nr:Protease 2 [Hordeum vulgare]
MTADGLGGMAGCLLGVRASWSHDGLEPIWLLDLGGGAGRLLLVLQWQWWLVKGDGTEFSSWSMGMGRLVNVHYMDKEAFLTNNADVDEESIVFDTSPSYDDLVAKVRHVLEWMDPNDGVKLIGSQPESEVEFHAPNAIRPPPTSQANEVDVIASEEVILKDGDVDCDFDEVEEGFHGIDIGDLDAYIAQKEMDRELPFRRLYGYDSDDEGP